MGETATDAVADREAATPHARITVHERRRPSDAFDSGVVFSDQARNEIGIATRAIGNVTGSDQIASTIAARDAADRAVIV